MTERVIGIDLGTTNSCVATVEGGEAKVIVAKGQRTTPSVVAFTNSGRRIVGHIAKRQAVTNPTGTISSVKRIIGRPFNHAAVRAAQERLPYTLVRGETGDARVSVLGRVYPVPEISAAVLTELKKAAEEYFKQPVEKAVITVPAYFNDGQRQATKDAGRIAGLDVLRIISEPTAAALAYGRNRVKEKTRVVVFDLGGGTFDVSVLDISGGTFEVVATSGDTFLGGDDFDLRIVDWMFAELKKDFNVEPRNDTMVLQRLRDAAEKAKIELSTAPSASIQLPFLYSRIEPATKIQQPVHFMRELSRDQLESVVADLLRRCVEITAKLLDDAKIALHQINEVILVGGMTRMPAVKNATRDYFGIEPAWNVNPDEVVALGAALHANGLIEAAGGGNPDLLLLDVTPHNLGIMIAGGYFRTLVPANSTVPTSASHVFATVQDNQQAVKIVVMQGASNVAAGNEVLGEFMLTNLPAGPRGSVEVEVTFDISAEGIVSVSALNMATGEEQSIEVTANEKLSGAEIERLIRENNKFAVEDKPANEELMRIVALLAGEVEKLLPRVQAALAAAGRDQTPVQSAQVYLQYAAGVAVGGDIGQLTAARDQLARMKPVLELLANAAPNVGRA